MAAVACMLLCAGNTLDCWSHMIDEDVMTIVCMHVQVVYHIPCTDLDEFYRLIFRSHAVKTMKRADTPTKRQ